MASSVFPHSKAVNRRENNMNPMSISVLAAILLSAGVLTAFLAVKNTVAAQRKQLEYTQQTYLRMQGYTQLWHSPAHPDGVNDHLVSVDAGKHWIALDESGRALGDAEIVYPGLLEQRRALDALVGREQPMQLERAADRELLEQVGFTVQVGKP
jgi:hypothetical protein